MSSTAVHASKRLTLKAYAVRAFVAALIATVLNIVVYYIGDAAGAFPSTIEVMAGKSLQISNVIMMSVLGTLIGMVIFAAVGSLKIFRIIAIVGFILLLFTPASVKDPTTEFVVYLEIMHVVATVVVLWVACWKKHA
ncbi:DUF6069 family protein [Paenibacillus sp. NEAU-GSW1]|uniref:DUF6069 family protein n=1 Tax=Paenibacillus sp. NEAU-GSW1 TaxID=2682486 RepID=UPI0012E1F551|nr:DUF6069 family protein [Paenibacillus sp. NEAU-GSW1]MUT65958.1 hypothetical protein [Paenibacillus sp. NEAU-GSW1]